MLVNTPYTYKMDSLRKILADTIADVLKSNEFEEILRQQMREKLAPFFEKVANKYNADTQEISSLFDSADQCQPNVEPKKTKKPKSDSEDDVPRCSAILGPRSERHGQVCGKKCDVSGLCGLHKKSTVVKGKPKSKPKNPKTPSPVMTDEEGEVSE